MEYDIPSNSLLKGGKDGWVKTIGPNAGTAQKRLLEKQGGEILPKFKNLSNVLSIK